ncbi:MAG: TonB-dependent receptor [Cyclobacteriaceae bacterium]
MKLIPLTLRGLFTKITSLLLVLSLVAFSGFSAKAATSKEDGTSSNGEVQRTVKGQVTDEEGNGIPGANVILKGTSSGSSTDIDGNYTINVTSDDDVLVFSFIGFASQEVTVGARSIVDVSLAVDVQALDEIVVIGYGTQKKSDLTGSVSTVKGEEIAKFSTANATQAIQGRMAGVRVEQNGGSPGAAALVTIRGAGTLSERQPLYVIDGMLANNMSSLNPGDIESVTVLKDASAAAIYGSRAGNGVIIVTTKKGKSGEIQVDFDMNYGVQKAVNMLDWANAQDYAAIIKMGVDNDNVRGAGLEYPEDVSTGFDPSIDSDIQAATLRNAPMANQSMRLSGGSENATYSFSMGHMKQDGIVQESSFERFNIRANSVFTKGRFKLEETLGITRTINNPNNYFNRERDIVPTIPIYDSEGNFTASREDGVTTYANVGNSLGVATLQDRTNTNNGLLGNVAGSLEIIEGLTYKLNLGLSLWQNHNYTFTPSYYFSDASTNGRNVLNSLNEANNWGNSLLVENTLRYARELGQHNIEVLAGYSNQKSVSKRLGVTANSFPNNDIRNAQQAANIQSVPSFTNTVGLVSQFGRLNYVFDDRYLITGTIRRDGSSLFKETNRWGVFPSAAIGWNISNEGFMSGVTAISGLKLRASMGEIGTNNAGAYVGDATINVYSSYPLGLGAQERQPGISITRAVNENLRWETTRITDIGVEFGILEDKVLVTMDYFKKQSIDVIAPYTPPLHHGRSGSVPANVASIENTGFEFAADYRNQIGDLNFGINANFTVLDNVVTEIGPSGPIVGGGFTSNGRSASLSDIGQPIAAFYGLKVLGIYQSEQEAIDDGRYRLEDPDDPGSARIATAGAGDLRFEDLDGLPGLSDDDMQYLGSPIPNFEYGFNINAEYKGLDVTMFFNGVSGNKIVNGNIYRAWFENDNNKFTSMLDSWTESNPSEDMPRFTIQDLAGNGTRMSDFLLEDGSYFRLRNLMIGYTIPGDFTDVVKLKRARVYVSAQNLFTMTKYTGYYPEVGQGSRDRGSNENIFNAGVDENAYPMAKNYQIGIQVNF